MKRIGIVGLKCLGGILALGALAFIGLYIGSCGDYRLPDTVNENPDLTAIELNGTRLHYKEAGSSSNPTIILVHGGPGGDFTSLLSLEPLSDRYHLVWYDQRGSGLSARNVSADSLTVDQFIEDLHAIVTHFGGGRPVILFGHSWGGMLSAAYTGRYPRTVSHLILAEPGFLTAETSDPVINPDVSLGMLTGMLYSWFQSLHVDDSDEYAAGDFWLNGVMRVANPAYYCPDANPHNVIVRAGYEAWYNVAVKGIGNSANDGSLNLTQGLDKFTGPSLIIAGACNTAIGPEHQEKHLPLVPNSRLVTIADAGHFMFQDKPVETMTMIQNFLNAVNL
ncbi:MAG: alpha/beta hydrolase [Leptospiraceae bacterium]|nr:alpha/beta hydrolase [Leptospiraceae bacterium]